MVLTLPLLVSFAGAITALLAGCVMNTCFVPAGKFTNAPPLLLESTNLRFSEVEVKSSPEHTSQFVPSVMQKYVGS